MRRRAFLASPVALLAAPAIAAEDSGFPAVRPGTPLAFPRDHGSHPACRTEWWYVTGWVRDPDGRDLGVQVTFFRTRTGIDAANPSRFAAQQLIIALEDHSSRREPCKSGRAPYPKGEPNGSVNVTDLDLEADGLSGA